MTTTEVMPIAPMAMTGSAVLSPKRHFVGKQVQLVAKCAYINHLRLLWQNDLIDKISKQIVSAFILKHLKSFILSFETSVKEK